MTFNKSAFTAKTLLLLCEEQSVCEHIEQALSTYCLSHHLEHHEDIESYLQAAMDAKRQSTSGPEVDLLLIAYIDNATRTQETLADLNQINRWRRVPTVVLVDRNHTELARRLYQLGANSVIRYPLSFDALRQLIQTMDLYWFDTVTLPSGDEH